MPELVKTGDYYFPSHVTAPGSHLFKQLLVDTQFNMPVLHHNIMVTVPRQFLKLGTDIPPHQMYDYNIMMSRVRKICTTRRWGSH
jgi:hypothetical protein